MEPDRTYPIFRMGEVVAFTIEGVTRFGAVILRSGDNYHVSVGANNTFDAHASEMYRPTFE